MLPWVLKVLNSTGDGKKEGQGEGAEGQDKKAKQRKRGRAAVAGDLAGAVAELTSWVADGSHRRDLDRNGQYEHKDAIRILDAWWPLLTKAVFEPTLGPDVYKELTAADPIDNHPNNHGDHLGSAWDAGFYGHVQKDLRALVGKKVKGRLSRIYCGGGSLAACRGALEASLREAAKLTAAQIYKGDAQCTDGDQMCWDSIVFRPLGAVTQPHIPWVNRPTFQQVVEIRGHR